MSWNSRFHVTKSRGNNENCSYFREYFDKPKRKTQRKIVAPKRANEKLNINGRFPQSRATAHRTDENVRGWDRYFSTTSSKVNEEAYASQRSFFTPYSSLPVEKRQKRPQSAQAKPSWNGSYYDPSSKNEAKYIKTRKLFC